MRMIANNNQIRSDSSKESTPGAAQHGDDFAVEDRHQRLCIVIDQPARRESLAYMLGAVLDECTVESYAALEEVPSSERGILLLRVPVDSDSADVICNIITQLKLNFSSYNVVIMSDCNSIEVADSAIRCGISGYLLPSAGIQTIVAAIRLAMVGGIYVPSDLIHHWTSCAGSTDAFNAIGSDETSLGNEPDTNVFTVRELDVIKCLQRGQPNKLIAYDLHMSESTVKVHMRNIMRKLGATNRTQVAFVTRSAGVNGAADAAMSVAAKALPSPPRCGPISLDPVVSVGPDHVLSRVFHREYR